MENPNPVHPARTQAIFQCLQGLPEGGMRRIILTASGGAFRDWPVERLREVTAADAVKHPNWRCAVAARRPSGSAGAEVRAARRRRCSSAARERAAPEECEAVRDCGCSLGTAA